MTNFFESELFEPIDLCSCFDPIFDPPPEQEAVWNFSEPEPTLENTSFYVTDPDGTEYFYCGGTRIKIREHFTSQGKEQDLPVVGEYGDNRIRVNFYPSAGPILGRTSCSN